MRKEEINELNEYYYICENGTIEKYTGKVLSPSIHKTKNYIEYCFKIKFYNEVYRFKLHKLMMQYFGLTKEQCIEKGFLHKYDPILYESLKKKDSAKNKKLSQQERIERLDDWCRRFIDRYDMVHNESRKQELYRYCYTVESTTAYHCLKEQNREKEFKHYVPDKNRLNQMIGKLMNDKELANYYFNTYLMNNTINSLYFTYENYTNELEKNKNKNTGKKEPTKKVEEPIIIEHNSEQFNRCEDAIRVCSSYTNSLNALIDMALQNDFIYKEDVEFILNNEVLLNKLRQYKLYNDTRTERVIENKDNKCYSNYVSNYINTNTFLYEVRER